MTILYVGGRRVNVNSCECIYFCWCFAKISDTMSSVIVFFCFTFNSLHNIFLIRDMVNFFKLGYTTPNRCCFCQYKHISWNAYTNRVSLPSIDMRSLKKVFTMPMCFFQLIISLSVYNCVGFAQSRTRFSALSINKYGIRSPDDGTYFVLASFRNIMYNMYAIVILLEPTPFLVSFNVCENEYSSQLAAQKSSHFFFNVFTSSFKAQSKLCPFNMFM
ncbi:MAG: hypothetical protein [Betabaculovirus sp.]|nr:MAG: hypothetical protein [Betabaculovirus sp.]